MCDRPTFQGKTHEPCLTLLGLDGFIAIAQYVEPISSLIKKVKYGGTDHAIKKISEIFISHWPSYAPQFDVFVPMPMHKQKQRIRGFNQATRIAQLLSKELHIPLSHVLAKIKPTIAQASLKRKERKARSSLDFSCNLPTEVQGKIIGLVDDVATTRTTLRLGCLELKKAGAKEVWGVVFAHRF